MRSKTALVLLQIALLASLGWVPASRALNGDVIDLTYTLTQSTASYQFWTTVPSERVFKDSAAPAKTVRRVENTGRANMVLIEALTGSYLGEDDILRYAEITLLKRPELVRDRHDSSTADSRAAEYLGIPARRDDLSRRVPRI